MFGAKKGIPDDRPKWVRILSVVGGILIGVGIGAAILLLTADGDLSLAIKILVPLFIVAAGLAAIYVPKILEQRKGKNQEGKVAATAVTQIRTIEIAVMASMLIRRGSEPRKSLKEAGAKLGPIEQQAIESYLSDGTGLLRTSEDRDLIDRVLTGQDPEKVLSAARARLSNRVVKKTSRLPIVISVTLGIILIAILAASS